MEMTEILDKAIPIIFWIFVAFVIIGLIGMVGCILTLMFNEETEDKEDEEETEEETEKTPVTVTITFIDGEVRVIEGFAYGDFETLQSYVEDCEDLIEETDFMDEDKEYLRYQQGDKQYVVLKSAVKSIDFEVHKPGRNRWNF